MTFLVPNQLNLTTASQLNGSSIPSPLIDNIATYPTPEGLTLTIMPAGLMPRVSAWLIDVLIKMIFYSIISVIGVLLGKSGFGFIAIGYFIVSWLYPVYFEVYRSGMTPGKKLQDIYVCHDDGTPITLQASLIRNLLRVADFLPFAYISAALTMLFNTKSQRIGDIVAGTIVVYRTENDVAKLFRSIYGSTAVLTNPNNYGDYTMMDSNPLTSNLPLFFYPLTLNEQQALLSFSERAPFLSKARQIEIVATLSPLMGIDKLDADLSNLEDSNELTAYKQVLPLINTRIQAIRGYNPSTSQPKITGDKDL